MSTLRRARRSYGVTDTPDRATLLREYLRVLGGACNRLSLADADSSDPTRAAVELAAVYTNLEVASLVALSEDEARQTWHPDHRQRQRTALEVVAEHPRLVLLGAPGSGKSTLVNFMTLCLAHSCASPAWLTRLGESWPHGALLPLRVTLREFAAWLTALPQCPLRGDVALFWAWLEQAQRMHPVLLATLRESLATGQVLLLLDGLDEVPSGHDDQIIRLVVQTIQALAAAVGSSRMLITCRILDYQEIARQLPGWPTDTIIALAPELCQAFIERWYMVLAKLDRPLNGAPDVLRQRLQDAVAERPELRRLAGNPLLLTMMTLLHAYEGRLPEERVRLYEKCIEFCWRAERGETPLRERLDLSQWTDSDLGRLIDRLGFVAHERGVSGDGEAGADLPRAVLVETARAFFAPYGGDQDLIRAQHFCNYISRHSNGIIQQHSQAVYRFPHRTFQEYLAARRLVSDEEWAEADSEFMLRAIRRADAGPQWREALLLAVSQQVVVNKQVLPAATLVEELLTRHPTHTPVWARDAILAGEVLAEVGRPRLERLGERRSSLWSRAVDALMAILMHLDEQEDALLPLAERVRAGQALALLGDPRFPVTSDDWRAAIAGAVGATGRSGQSAYFCRVPAGTYRIGGWKEDEPSAAIALPDYWIARFPITVAQYRAFIAAGGYDKQAWWTAHGWVWKQNTSWTEPCWWDDPRYSSPNQPVIGMTWYEATAFCAWLTEYLADALPVDYVLRLPTEAEWEAAVAYDGPGERRMYPWGQAELTPERAIYDESKLDRPAPVGCCPAGAAAGGALDMAGNVWEWTIGSYKQYPEANHAKDLTLGDRDVVFRGGAWNGGRIYVSCGARVGNPPDSVSFRGFRVFLASRSKQMF